MNENNLATYYFHQGTNFEAYAYFGAHKLADAVFVFRTWAPKADSVELVGNFNSWGYESSEKYFFKKITENGVWELYVNLPYHDEFLYKFKITNKNKSVYKSDPFAFFSECETKSASIFHNFQNFDWKDKEWLKYCNGIERNNSASSLPVPINIYEVHLDSFCKSENGNRLNYRQYADILAPYVKRMGFTHVELLPIAEHPYGKSWGYQLTGYYAPTSRFGRPEDFKYFVDKMHSNGIGVILDWVPAHFPKNEEGLYEFDGEKCYEYQSEWRCEHKGWGTRSFDLGRGEVQSFLISNAVFWLEEYHIDGLRIDAVASMLYLDYDRRGGEWVPNTNGTNESLEGIAFFKKLNTVLHKKFPRAIIIAEESTEWKNVTSKSDDLGLGFDLKWNMGWMHDTLDYCSMNPFFRKNAHDKLTFSFFYAFSERFVLPISHDEVVHGKKSLIDKFSGNIEEKFKTFRTFYSYMIAHPGKKLLFMGSEFGQFAEWDSEKSLEWFMTDFKNHADLQKFVADINHFYLKNSELWEIDFSWEGFEWIVSDDNEQNIIVFERYNKKRESIICCFNFSPVSRSNYKIGVKESGMYEEIFNSDTDGVLKETLVSTNEKMHGREFSIKLNLPAYSGIFFKKCERTVL